MRTLAATALIAVALAGCRPDTRSPVTVVEGSGPVAAFAPLSGGSFRYAELRTGRVLEVNHRGERDPRPLVSLEVTSEGQRGLLGLAIGQRGRTFATWTRPDGRIVVGEVFPGPQRLVWLGPESRDVANGGHLVPMPDGSLLVGIGDLEQPDLVDDPSAPNGKIMRLDPDAGPDQTPEVVSSGWNNPFAFAVSMSGRVWVADNAPGRKPEVLADGDRRGLTELPARTVPSGLAAAGDDLLVLCGYRTGVVQPYRVVDGRPRPEGEPRATDCRYGVSVLADGRVVYAAADSLRTVRL
ncbi:MAG TPA: PQQ-dependent sugar dehydrogenase [Actinomycetota bacterium]|nr:PQQ-dependent sugar dehydrogenase [Actinomycetota bacterium]